MNWLPFPGVSEQVIRHRDAQRDEDGKWIPGTDDPLESIAVAPGGGSQTGQRLNVERAREGETIACTVYFVTGTDIVNSDELTVRGERFSIIVNDWRMAEFGGVEVLCTRGEG